MSHFIRGFVNFLIITAKPAKNFNMRYNVK